MPDDRAREQMQALVEVLEDIRRVAWDPQISDPFARAHIQSEVNRILSAHLAWISVSDSWCGERAREALAGAADEPEGRAT
jgi:hypothetical protein